MASLLTLPQELRDEILSLVVSSRIVAPVDGVRSRTIEFQLHAPIHLTRLPEAYRPPCLPLLLTNKQLLAETLLVIKRGKAVVEMDFVFVDMARLWPTYRVVTPRIAGTTFDRVVVNVSLAASDESARLDTDMYGLFWLFIDRFLVYGPVKPSKPSIVPNIYVEELRVNFESRSSDSEFSIEEVPHRLVQGEQYESRYQWLYGVDEVEATRCIDFFIENLNLQHETCPFSEPYFAALVDQIRRMTVFVNGQLRCKVDLEKLAPKTFASAEG